MTTSRATQLALPERNYVHDQVADERGIDPRELSAELADAIRSPLAVPSHQDGPR